MEQTYAIELQNITKRFGSVVANDKVSLSLRKGEILCVLGENGSGKTTLVNMISGIYYPEEGRITVDGREVKIRSPKDSFDLGIGMVHQHFKLVDILTAAENIILGLPGRQRLNMKQVNAEISALADKYGFELDPRQKIYEMSVSQKQTVEIVKMLYRGARILILDEPTAVLTPQEADRLFEVLRNMKKDGCSIILITHKLHEVLAVSDRVSILRKGHYIDTVDTADATVASLTEMMVGTKVDLNIDRPEPKNRVKRLELTDVTCTTKDGIHSLDHASLTVYGGEILGIAGIAGSGQKELLEAIAGLEPVTEGAITFYPDAEAESDAETADATVSTDAAEGKAPAVTSRQSESQNASKQNISNVSEKASGKNAETGSSLGAASGTKKNGAKGAKENAPVRIDNLDVAKIRSLGVRLAFVPEDRLGMGLVGSMDMTDNMMLRSYRRGHSEFLDRRTPGKLAAQVKDQLEIVTPSISAPVGRMSGGNVQKVLVGREIAQHPKVLMVAYPTRGIDINSSYTIYHLLNEQKERGIAVICVIEDLDVLMELCDRIAVLCGGQITGIVDGRTTKKDELGVLMTKRMVHGSNDPEKTGQPDVQAGTVPADRAGQQESKSDEFAANGSERTNLATEISRKGGSAQ
ncbi:MAG: ABC transporter ATP-binding protein [Clostridiales bacterium]|nr:ABC transporter ATP-binding protein [Clostridiales bacterium]